MTGKLYYQDQFIKEFTASIISISEDDGEYHVVLDQTAFYPEGGGQPSDTGTIAGLKVKYVYTEKGQIFHVMESLPLKRKNLDCKLDWERRFDHMQQHTGEHILSAVFKRRYNAVNIGFHLGEDYVSIDLDQDISEKKIWMAEKEANNAVYANLKIKAVYPQGEELKKLDLRKEPTVEDNIRIVMIGDLDFSPCGGTHMSASGQVGLIKIIDFSNYKGGTRVKFLCGRRAVEDYQFKNKIVKEIRQELAAQNEDLAAEVARIKEDIKQKEKIINELNNRLLDYRTEELIDTAENIKGIRIITRVFNDLDFNDVKTMAARLTAEDNIIVIMGQKDNSAARLILSRSNESGLNDIKDMDMNKIIKTPLKLIDGNGGGNKLTAQGGGSKSNNIDNAVSNAYQLIKGKLQ